MAAAAQPELVRAIRRWDLVAVTINGIIGAGIFGLPSKVFALAGEYSLLAFFVCAVAASLIVLCFAEVSSRFTGTGGPYVYAGTAFGATTGFAVGWLVWLARLTSFSANANILADYLTYFFPGAAGGAERAVLLAIVVLALVALNVIGIRDVTRAGNFFAVGKLLPLVVFVGVGLFFLRAPATGPTATVGAFSTSVLMLIYAFSGFEMTTIPAGEMRDPQRDLPMALLTAMAGVVGIYLLIQVVCMGTLPTLATSDRPLADAAAHFLGAPGALLIMVGILLSIGGNLNTVLLAGSRTLFAMGERRDLPGVLAAVHPRFRTPVWAVLITGGIMLTLTLSGGFVRLLTISALARVASYVVTCAALIRLRRSATAPPAVFRLRWGVGIAIAAGALGVWMLTSAGMRELRDTALALLAGLLLFGMMRIRGRGAHAAGPAALR